MFLHTSSQTLATKDQLSAEEAEESPEALEAELLAAVFDPKRPSSLRKLADRVQLLVMQVRDRTSNDVWTARLCELRIWP